MDYISRQKKCQREIVEKIRALITVNFPKLNETVMTEGLWYEGKFYITTFKDHVNLGLGITGLTPDEIRHLEGKGKSMRHIKFYSVNDIKDTDLLKLMKIVYLKTDCTCKINWKN